MKTGKTLTQLATEIERQVKSKRDFVADTRQLKLVTDEQDNFGMMINSHGRFGMTEIAHEQVAGRLGIPQKYYDRMRKESPYLLLENANHWLRSVPEKRLVRTLDGNARAFLSDRYRPLDNFELAENVLPKLQKAGCRVESCELTERRMYIKAVTERVTGEVKKGDVVQAGIVISNSEIGCGSVRIEPMLLRLVCMNGAIINDTAMRKYHVGRGNGDDFEGVEEFFRDSTRQAADKAFWMKVRDVVDATLDQVMFSRMLERMKDATANAIAPKADIPQVVERMAQRLNLNENEGKGVLNHLIMGGDLSQYGLFNAVTRTAQDIESYDRATDLERAGWQVIELSRHDWDSIASRN